MTEKDLEKLIEANGMTVSDLEKLIEAEEKRLKLHDPEFMQRHREIMETADRIRQENKKRL